MGFAAGGGQVGGKEAVGEEVGRDGFSDGELGGVGGEGGEGFGGCGGGGEDGGVGCYVW